MNAQHHPTTKLMAGDVRSKEDAIALAGVDFVVLPPKIIADLDAAPSTLGYNDGLSATHDYPAEIRVQMTPASALASEEEAGLAGALSLDERAFGEAMGLAGRELLEVSLKRYVDSFQGLEPYFIKYQVSGQ